MVQREEVMKRSEMVNRLYELLKENGCEYPSLISHMALEIVELEGMLPPLNNIITDSTPSVFISEYCDADEYYCWEEEDE